MQRAMGCFHRGHAVQRFLIHIVGEVRDRPLHSPQPADETLQPGLQLHQRVFHLGDSETAKPDAEFHGEERGLPIAYHDPGYEDGQRSRQQRTQESCTAPSPLTCLRRAMLQYNQEIFVDLIVQMLEELHCNAVDNIGSIFQRICSEEKVYD